MEALGRFTVRWRWPIIAAWLLAASLSLLALPQVGSILRAGGFSADGIEAEEAFERYEQDFGAVGSPIQIAFHHDEWLVTDEAFAAEAARVLAPLAALPDVMRVSTYQDHPTQIAPGGHTAYATLFFDLHPDVAHRIVPELRERLEPSELDVHIAGSPVYYSDIQTLSESDLQRAETVGLPFALIVLVLVFGSVVAAGIPVLAGGASVVVGLALLWLFGQQVGFSIFALNVVTLVGLGLGADYSLILVSRFREELAAGQSVHDAVPRTVATAGKAVVFSGAAVLTGLASLMVFEFMMLRSIGAGGALVVLIAVAAATTFVPALLAVLGPRVNLWRVWRPRVGPQNGWARLARAVMRRPLPIFLSVSLFLVVLGLPFLHVRLNAPDARVLTPDSPSRVAYEFLRDEFGEGHQTPLFLVARFPDGALAPEAVAAQHALTRALEADPRVARVGGITALDPRITLEQYQLLYSYAPGIGDPWARALAETFTRENAAFMLVEPSVPATSPEA
ncbi:MAG: MMPL family transporter [Chloroflexi bacterium]|nr:MMPL family transporter [Chloroflexota bacterium]